MPQSLDLSGEFSGAHAKLAFWNLEMLKNGKAEIIEKKKGNLIDRAEGHICSTHTVIFITNIFISV